MTPGAPGGALARRHLVPEILDALPPGDARARRSRADLRRINLIMRQAAIADALISRHLTPVPNRPLRLLEVGAGDGHAMLRLARRLVRRHSGATLTLLDISPVISRTTLAGFVALGWTVDVVKADAFAWLAATDQRFDLAIANLFLHHFEDDDLSRLLQGLALCADLLIATEPLRTSPSLLASRLVALIGANDVTRHDAPASVRAGFRGAELGALWSPCGGDVLEEGVGFPFTHAFAARSGT